MSKSPSNTVIPASRTQPLRLVLAQLRSSLGDLSGNYTRAHKALQFAQKENADLLVLPELFLLGYYSRDWFYNSTLIRKEQNLKEELFHSAESTTIIIGSTLPQPDGRIYNGATAYSPFGYQIDIPKHYLPFNNVFYEHRYFDVPPSPFKPIINIKDWAIGVVICEDMWRPSHILARHFEQEIDLLIIINASPFTPEKHSNRLRLVQEHAKFFDSYVAYVNIWGAQEEVVFDGQSFIVSPTGALLKQARAFGSEYLVIDLPTEASSHLSVPSSSKAEHLFHAVWESIRRYFYSLNQRKAIVGLSGGIDSAVVATIAAKVLGPHNVKAIFMPSRYTSEESRNGAEALAQNLGIEFKEISIEPILNAFELTLGISENDGVAFQNIQSRIRGSILMLESNRTGALVLNTGNKSELAVGYFTLYGDGIGAWSVLGDILKTEVYEIAQLINKRWPETIPQIILSRPPTAELAPNQSDEKDLMPYSELDPVLKEMIPLWNTPESSDERWLFKRIVSTEYKRRQTPPFTVMSDYNLGIGRMLPMTTRYLDEILSYESMENENQ